MKILIMAQNKCFPYFPLSFTYIEILFHAKLLLHFMATELVYTVPLRHCADNHICLALPYGCRA